MQFMCIEYECSWMNMNVKIRALKNMAFFGCDILREIEPFNHNQNMKLYNEKKNRFHHSDVLRGIFSAIPLHSITQF